MNKKRSKSDRRKLNKTQIDALLRDRNTMTYRMLAAKYNISRASAWNYVNANKTAIRQGDLNDKEANRKAMQAIFDSLIFTRSEIFQTSYTQFMNINLPPPTATQRVTQTYAAV